MTGGVARLPGHIVHGRQEGVGSDLHGHLFYDR